MRLREPLRRTGITELADDELLLFDALFACPWPVRALRQAEYGYHLCVDYSHGLDDATLKARIVDLADRGLIDVQIEDPAPHRGWEYCGLTPAGGALWELEREPDWNKYCSDRQDAEGNYVFDAYCEQAAVACMHAYEAAGFVAFDLAKAACHRFEPGERRRAWPLISWKESSLDYSIVVPGEYRVRQPHEVDMSAEYESRRWWWRIIGELATLQRPEFDQVSDANHSR